jgi:hypothetical protein
MLWQLESCFGKPNSGEGRHRCGSVPRSLSSPYVAEWIRPTSHCLHATFGVPLVRDFTLGSSE